MKEVLDMKKNQICWSLVCNITYAQTVKWFDSSFMDLKLDLILPKHKEDRTKYPLLIWLCGGAFQSVDKEVWIPQWTEFARNGIIFASVEYRTANEAPFPAALEDVKAAIRFLKANADKYAIDTEKIYVAGESAGGCLASLVGVYGKNSRYDVGNYLSFDSSVQGIIDFYGVVDFINIEFEENSTMDLVKKNFFLDNNQKVWEEASAYKHVDEETPPFIILHGAQDELVPIEQSDRMYAALKEHNIPVQYYVLKNCGHGADEFYQNDILSIINKFVRNSQK